MIVKYPFPCSTGQGMSYRPCWSKPVPVEISQPRGSPVARSSVTVSRSSSTANPRPMRPRQASCFTSGAACPGEGFITDRYSRLPGAGWPRNRGRCNHHAFAVRSAGDPVRRHSGPAQDRGDGVTASYPPPGVAGKDLRIRHAETGPGHASVAVRYRDGWFYIDEKDQATKWLFRLLGTVYSITIAGNTASDSTAPVLTVPVSRWSVSSTDCRPAAMKASNTGCPLAARPRHPWTSSSWPRKQTGTAPNNLQRLPGMPGVCGRPPGYRPA